MFRYMSTHKRHLLLGFLALIVVALIVARLYLSTWMLHYVNRTLNNIEGYQGSVEGIEIELYRGAYKIHKLVLNKKSGHIPTPFIAVDTVDFSIQWDALLHGRVVSNIDLIKPEINFAVSKTGQKQTGKEADWTKTIKDLAPIDINKITFSNGKLTYQDFSANPHVDVYIHHMSGNITNLRNVVDKNQPLPSTVLIKGDSIGNGALKIDGRMNILKLVPDMDLNAQLENVNLVALNDYSNAYGAIDIRHGKLDLYSEFIIQDNRIKGYVKPIATDVALIDLNKSANPIKLAWQSVVSVVMEVFTNHAKNQFATKVPLEGRLDKIDTDTWSTIGAIVHNAFVAALKKGFDSDTKFTKTGPAQDDTKKDDAADHGDKKDE